MICFVQTSSIELHHPPNQKNALTKEG